MAGRPEGIACTVGARDRSRGDRVERPYPQSRSPFAGRQENQLSPAASTQIEEVPRGEYPTPPMPINAVNNLFKSVRFIDFSHPAGPERRKDLIRSEVGSSGQAHTAPITSARIEEGSRSRTTG
jgi:hypothetical protein